jgi:hypothetical protein
MYWDVVAQDTSLPPVYDQLPLVAGGSGMLLRNTGVSGSDEKL